MVKSEFIANISHELRTPLNAIIGFSKLMADQDGVASDAKQAAEYAGVIHESAGDLLLIINDIITISKLQSGKYEVVCEAVDADEVVRSAARRAETQIEGTGKSFTHEVVPGAPAIWADPACVAEIVKRLVANAIKFSGDTGKIALSVKAGGEGRVAISISDDGIGMTPEQVQLALRPFRQIDTRLNRSHGGAGLGLTIVGSMVKLLDGDIAIDSEPDRGTEVTVHLPADGSASKLADEAA